MYVIQRGTTGGLRDVTGPKQLVTNPAKLFDKLLLVTRS